MKEIQLREGELALVDDETHSYLAALGPWRLCEGFARRTGRVRGRGRRGPKALNKFNFMHHEVFRFIGIDTELIDFRDRNRLNCQLWNLRPATKAQDTRNRTKQSNNTSGYIGVYSTQGRWLASITFNGKQMHIGYYDTPEEAARARDNEAIRLHGEFASLNFFEPIVPEPFDVVLSRLRQAVAA